MNPDALDASRVIESVRKALAHWTVTRFAELDPTLGQRYGSSWDWDWSGHVGVHLDFLVQSVALRRREVFADAVAWSKAAFDARDVGNEDLRTSLMALADVVAENLEGAIGQVAAEHVRYAFDHFRELPRSMVDFLPDTPQERTRVLRYLEALLSGRRDDAQDVALAAAEAGNSVMDIYEQLLEPAQRELGRMWLNGEITVADEHLATATTQCVMALLRTRVAARSESGHTLLAAVIAGEHHDIGLQMVADFFDMAGWETLYLGANTPTRDILDMLSRHKCHLLALSVGTGLHLREAGELIDMLRADPTCGGTRVLVGGRPFQAIPDLWKDLGADACAGSARAALQVGSALMARG